MSPPLHVKIVLIANTLPILAGVRSIYAPGLPLSWTKFAELKHFHHTPGTKWVDAEPFLGSILRIFGICVLAHVLTKVVTVFGGRAREGTFLRRQLLFVLGLLDVGIGAILLRFNVIDKAVIRKAAWSLVFEGAVFLADAVFRPRPVKPAAPAAAPSLPPGLPSKKAD